MKQNDCQKHRKTLLTITSAVLLCAATWLGASSTTAAFEKKKGEDVGEKNCERVEANGSSTFGKCASVCKGKEVTFKAEFNKWVCTASRPRPTDSVRPPVSNGGVNGKTSNPTATPIAMGSKTGKVK